MNREPYPRRSKLWFVLMTHANVIPAPLARFTCELECRAQVTSNNWMRRCEPA